MQMILDWLRANSDVFGFVVASLIFTITIVLVSRKLIGFTITLLLLLFALVTGLVIGHQDVVFDHFKTEKSP